MEEFREFLFPWPFTWCRKKWKTTTPRKKKKSCLGSFLQKKNKENDHKSTPSVISKSSALRTKYLLPYRILFLTIEFLTAPSIFIDIVSGVYLNERGKTKTCIFIAYIFLSAWLNRNSVCIPGTFSSSFPLYYLLLCMTAHWYKFMKRTNVPVLKYLLEEDSKSSLSIPQLNVQKQLCI